MEETIEALQEAGVQACAKHWIGNEQETQRNPTLSPTNKTIEAVSANIDDRTMHELYMWPFANAVNDGESKHTVAPIRSTNICAVFLQSSQLFICLSKQQSSQRSSEGRAWLPRLCHV